MSIIQIVLLILGAVLFVLSFIVPDKSKNSDNDSYLNEREMQNVAQDALNDAGDKLSEMVEETVQYAMEKSERGLERISNEKIMAVSEYSEAVMSDMEKSHKEIIFLYDMLNEKTTALKNSIREAEELRLNIDKANATLVSEISAGKAMAESVDSADVKENSEEINIANVSEKIISTTNEMIDTETPVNTSIPDIYGGSTKGNKNEKVLALHEEGKSNVAIAKELGLGVGEVKLVIDLFKGAK